MTYIDNFYSEYFIKNVIDNSIVSYSYSIGIRT